MSQCVPNTREMERKDRLLNDLVHQAERPVLVEFLAANRSARTDADYFDVQLKLLGRLKARQLVIGGLRGEIKAMRTQCANLAAREPKPVDELRRLQGRLAILEHQLNAQEALGHQLLAVGDALAWRRLGYDRPAGHTGPRTSRPAPRIARPRP